ncbi:hypothetical protein DT037_06080 [Pseudomonas fulva]|nr:hypothetical protein [Pseudomonas fulva]
MFSGWESPCQSRQALIIAVLGYGNIKHMLFNDLPVTLTAPDRRSCGMIAGGHLLQKPTIKNRWITGFSLNCLRQRSMAGWHEDV